MRTRQSLSRYGFVMILTCLFTTFLLILHSNKRTRTNTKEQYDEKHVAAIIDAFQRGDLNVQTKYGSNPLHKSDENLNSLFKGYNQLSFRDLENNYIPNEIYYVWCYNRTIEFQHYLSILASWKFMRPDAITFYTKYNITDKNEHYNFWLTELMTSVPGFRIQTLPKSWDGDEHGCGVWFAAAVLNDVGGIFLSNNLFPMKSLGFMRKNKFVVGTTKDMKEISFIASAPKNERLKSFMKSYKDGVVSPALVPGLHFCETINNITQSHIKDVLCVHVDDILPAHIMHLNSSFGETVRTVVYGQRDEIEVEQFLPGFIPKIFHLVWFGVKTMDFTMYLCLRSILTIVRPDKVYIHGDGLMNGHYLKKLKKDRRVVFVHREIPQYIYGNRILYMQHRSDIIRADVLLKYGGIYTDWDVLWLKPIDDLISTGYDTILNLDHMPRPGYPDSINLGVLMSKPGAHFIKHWQDSLINYRSRDFYFNAIELPFKMFEKYPETVHIEPHLQVMCFYLKCHPTFHPQFRNFNVPQPFNWTTDVYSIHFTHPDPPAYANETALRQSKGMFTDIANFILNQYFKYD